MLHNQHLECIIVSRDERFFRLRNTIPARCLTQPHPILANMYTPAATPLATLWSVARELWRHFTAVALYVSVIEYLDIRYEWKENAFPLPVIAIMGTVIGLLLAFRTNSCYGRWWEARILWGAIVNDSRTWTRQLIEFASKPLISKPLISKPLISKPLISKPLMPKLKWWSHACATARSLGAIH